MRSNASLKAKGILKVFLYISFFFTPLSSLSLEEAALKASPSTTEPPKAKWTFLIYAEADSILNSFAARNFQAMSTVGSNENLNIIVQWNQPKKSGVWRYKIEKNKMTLVNNNPIKKRDNFAQDLIDFSDFSVKNFPAENYALILWNHGLGILDPEWSELQRFAINPAALGTDPRIQIKATTIVEGDTFSEKISSSSDKTVSLFSPKNETDDAFRGILFDIANKNYLDNQGLIYALSQITTNITKKKFAIIGMDACLMSMFEVFYQIRHFADYAVSSEEVELAQGWNYSPVFYTLATTSVTSTKKLAQNIVHTFEDFYKNQTKFYTQSAVNLSEIDLLKQNLDQIVSNVILCRRENRNKINLAIKKARRKCFQLSVSCYVDLYSFYSELYKQIDKIKHQNTSEEVFLQELKDSLSDGMYIIDNIVVANVASNHLSKAKGISIYYPKKAIDPSYFNTVFVQDSLWLPFLQKAIR